MAGLNIWLYSLSTQLGQSDFPWDFTLELLLEFLQLGNINHIFYSYSYFLKLALNSVTTLPLWYPLERSSATAVHNLLESRWQFWFQLLLHTPLDYLPTTIKYCAYFHMWTRTYLAILDFLASVLSIRQLSCCLLMLRNVNMPILMKLFSSRTISVLLRSELQEAKWWETFLNQLENLGKASWKRWFLSFLKVERKLAKWRGGEEFSRTRTKLVKLKNKAQLEGHVSHKLQCLEWLNGCMTWWKEIDLPWVSYPGKVNLSLESNAEPLEF